MSVGFDGVLERYRELSTDESTKGLLFERMVAKYLLTDPEYANEIEEAWLWKDWPLRWQNQDCGIDIVAKTCHGDYWAIQCKFYSDNHRIQRDDIDSFLASSGRRFEEHGEGKVFAFRLIAATTNQFGANATEILESQSTPVGTLLRREFEASPIDWDLFAPSDPENLRRAQRKELREDQQKAIEAVRAGFVQSDRGKMIMACGTGKTFTSLRLSEEIVGESGAVLFLAPSISLVSQSLRAWTADAIAPFRSFVVCSDSRVGKEDGDIRTVELAYPPTTDASKLASAIKAVSGDRKVVFATYQSIDVVIAAQQELELEFDLVICDEAHRTTGVTLESESASEFVKVHDGSLLPAVRRLYMTATPRIYSEASHARVLKKQATLYSMDDEALYGPVFYQLGFAEALTRNLLADYKVLIVAVDEDHMAGVVNEYNAAVLDSKGDLKTIDLDFAARIVGTWKGLSKTGVLTEAGDLAEFIDKAPMKRAVAYSSSIANSELLVKAFRAVTRSYEAMDQEGGSLITPELHHIDGTANVTTRQEMLDWLRSEPEKGAAHVLSNAKLLSEGIDVPDLDAVVFFDTRESIVDIVQAVGRVMRKAEGKSFGYIVLPVAMPLSRIESLDTYLDSTEFSGVWKVIKALRAHDESLVDEAEFRRKIQVATVRPRKGDDWDESEQLKIPFPVEDLTREVYAVIPTKLGDREYWAEWAVDVADIARRIEARLDQLLLNDHAGGEFDSFVHSLRQSINPVVSEAEAKEMLVQQLITRPIFEAIFEGYDFMAANPVSEALDVVLSVLDEYALASETEGLEPFYESVRQRISLAKSAKSRQEVIKNLYDSFFKAAFPDMAERLGIVYTPVEVVDFILKSVDHALETHFDTHISDSGVHIIDPFAGTGTFLVRLLNLGLIDIERLSHKFKHELHANEIVLLAYYIAGLNIENAYQGLAENYEAFPGMVLTDSFQLMETRDNIDSDLIPGNTERAVRQRDLDVIEVVVANPPYRSGQRSGNDNNQNVKYPKLRRRIKDTYAANSSATLQNSLYASEFQALRWASDRIGDKGVVAFVTNNSFIDGNSADGVRKSLMEEYSSLYVFNLRGNQRTSGELSRKEGGKIFGSGSRNGIAILIAVKDPSQSRPAEIFYHDIGDYLTREAKLATIRNLGSIEQIEWMRLSPNSSGDWINQRSGEFDSFTPLGEKKSQGDWTIFSTYSRGLATSRDIWAYNLSSEALTSNMSKMIEKYNSEVDRVIEHFGHRAAQPKEVESFVDKDPRKIKWTRELYKNAADKVRHDFETDSVRQGMYRPFMKRWAYFNRDFNNCVYLLPSLFPTPQHENQVIAVTGPGSNKPFSVLLISLLPDLEVISKSQCFPRYWYSKSEQKHGTGLFEVADKPDEDWIKEDAITGEALLNYRNRYQDDSISKDDIFNHVYGVLHSPEYRERFEHDLRRMLPRIPYPDDFWAFANAGRELGELHRGYESVEPFPLEEIEKVWPASYRLGKLRFAGSDKNSIVYNETLELAGIPREAYSYQVNGKSALEWLMDNNTGYGIRTDRESGITNDPNEWCREAGDERYVVELIKRIVTVSVRTVAIAKSLPDLGL